MGVFVQTQELMFMLKTALNGILLIMLLMYPDFLSASLYVSKRGAY